jgi:hypothetical protein
MLTCFALPLLLLLLMLSPAQLGTCSISLEGLLRQGQELSELLLEVPLLQASSSLPTTAAAGAAAGTALLDSAAAAAAVQHGAGGQQPMQLGHVVVRLINIGREPSNSSARVQGFDAAEAAAAPGTPGKKVSRGLLWKTIQPTRSYATVNGGLDCRSKQI